MNILAATGNGHKLRELRAILEPHGVHVLGAADVKGIPEVDENAVTFAGNAVKKALEVAVAKGCVVLADDSGLEVRALGGAPGVYSARYAGLPGNDPANVAKLLANLRGVTDRAARFVCVLAVATPRGLIGTATGQVSGRIIDAPRGGGGFGYDPIFVPDGFDLTFAELPAAEKNRMSHRAHALQAALAQRLFDFL